MNTSPSRAFILLCSCSFKLLYPIRCWLQGEQVKTVALVWLDNNPHRSSTVTDDTISVGELGIKVRLVRFSAKNTLHGASPESPSHT